MKVNDALQLLSFDGDQLFIEFKLHRLAVNVVQDALELIESLFISPQHDDIRGDFSGECVFPLRIDFGR